MIRLFAAVEIPPEIGADLLRRQRGIEGARWRPLEALHITLRFIGEIPEDVAADLDAELSQITAPPLELVLEGAGSFGERRDARAVWVGVADNPALRSLAAKCETAARRAGLKPEKRPYRPHVTLAYLKRAHPAEVGRWVADNNLLQSPPFRVTWFGLWSSTLHPKGSRYDLQREYPLQ
ncbi:MAG: RNA 2',3'-cyclic phosphodiesterase [Proteobacteria bacterium]|nr:RNA 2',3'-cyclic phosphodiesterase [Pseudomonadota bacterium]